MSQKIVNPFRHQPHGPGDDHDHDHGHDGHDHDHDHHHEPDEQFDPAQQSLADALKVSFMVLKLFMAVMAVAYVFSNVFSVSSQEVAVRLRFGRIVGEGEAAVIRTGGLHFAMPYPFEQVLRVPVNPQQIDLRNEFWWETPPGMDPDTAPAKMGPLTPEKDGANITGDKNVVHTQWSVHFKIDKPVDYFTHVNDPNLARELISSATQEAIVFALAQLEADQVIRAQVSTDATVQRIQRVLDDMSTGLKIDRLQLRQQAMPGPVKEAYKAVLTAESEKAQNIEAAQQEHDKIMGETAGEAHKPLWSLIREYERAFTKADAPDADAAAVKARDAQLKRLDEVFRDLKLPESHGGIAVSGKVAEQINEAQNYRSSIVATLQAEANTFESLYGVYNGNDAMRRIVIGRLTQDTREAIFGGDVETIRMPASALKYLELSRDPLVNAKRQEQLLIDRRNASKPK
ncbi:MAG: SPFH domain-containing protein [Planctomycetota bacterium]|nr:SPFH domain-containing protein [Planctomycetota bacterium]